ncbi:hypothetical protein BVC71_02455 [Marivivens niveibacter]|uniref:Uncharacterized protein n=1 Tax=Marivivens niveibacter TaxID=1930667 RepID=A0A251X119_9RHOB|nr:tetratricopeptide repeat protein [Marivivens niveibacter]OUD10387.1 hypothetical protein BVC71_02455 [Marivivens niveibacter]
MGTITQTYKPIVTAFAIVMGGSLAAWAQTATVDDLFERLQDAEEAEVSRLESQIMTEWSKSGSPAVDFLLQRGQEAIGAGDFPTAVDHFTAAINYAPDFAEAYNGRATAFFMMGELGPSIDDIRQTLVLNPRHFGALMGFGAILEMVGQPDRALEVYEKIQDMIPEDPNANAAIDRLTLDLQGQTL